MPKHVFISYARDDGQEIAIRLHDDLESNSVDAWLDLRDIRGGEVWDKAITRGLATARAIVVILTPGAVISLQVQSEWNDALDRHLPIIPLLAKNCEIPRLLKVLNWIDFRESYNVGLATLRQRLSNLSDTHLAYLRQRLEELETAHRITSVSGGFLTKITDLREAIAAQSADMNPAPMPSEQNSPQFLKRVGQSIVSFRRQLVQQQPSTTDWGES